ncbi:MAG: CdaR family protein [Deinococcota bacterium]
MRQRFNVSLRHLWLRLLRHWPQKLTAVIIAVFLWLFVTTEQITTSQRSFLVPLTIIGLTNNQLATGVPEVVEVGVSGESNRIDALRAENIEAILDLSNVSSDFARPVRVSPPQGITLLRRNPSEVIGTIETRTQRTIAITPAFLRTSPQEEVADADFNTVAPPSDTSDAAATPTDDATNSASVDIASADVNDDMLASSPLFHNLQYQIVSEPTAVTVIGRSQLVDSVVQVVAPVNLEQHVGVGEPVEASADEAASDTPVITPLPDIAPFEVRLYASDIAGNPVSGIVLEPERVTVRLTASYILHTKRLPLEVILPNLSDFVVESRQLSQTNVLVAGRYDALQALERVVASANMSEQPPRERNLSMAVSLQLPDGIMALETPILNLRLSRIRDFPFTPNQ